MTAKRWDGAVQVDLTTFKRWDGAVQQDIATGQRWDGATWVDMGIGGGGLSATVSANNIYNQEFVAGPPPPYLVLIVSGNATVTAVGGAGAGPTYAWSRVSGSSSITATNPGLATTAFSAYVGRDQSVTARFKCTVTRGAETVEVFVDVTLELTVI